MMKMIFLLNMLYHLFRNWRTECFNIRFKKYLSTLYINKVLNPNHVNTVTIYFFILLTAEGTSDIMGT